MATMPLVAKEPWGHAEQFTRSQDDLFKLFQQQAFIAEQNDLTRAQTNNTQQNSFGQQDASQAREFAFKREGQEADNNFKRELFNMRNAGSNEDLLANYREQFREIERAKGLPEGTLDAFAEIESGSGRNVRASKSSAKGPFQFLDATAKRFNLKDPMDPLASAVATAEYASQNRDLFRKQFGRDPTGRELYLMHQQGEGGGPKLLANPGGRAVDTVGLLAVLNNGGHANMTSAEFAELIQRKYDSADNIWQGRRSKSQQAQAPTTVQQSAPQSGQQQSAAAPQANASGAKTMPDVNKKPDVDGTIIEQRGDIIKYKKADGSIAYKRVGNG